MPKHLVFALLISVSGLTATAWSQPAPEPRPGGTMPAQPGTPQRGPAETMPHRGMDKGMRATPRPGMDQPGAIHEEMRGAHRMNMHAGDGPPPPRDWNRGRDEWNRHVELCQKRFRTYNAQSDRYVLRRGVTRRCEM